MKRLSDSQLMKKLKPHLRIQLKYKLRTNLTKWLWKDLFLNSHKEFRHPKHLLYFRKMEPELFLPKKHPPEAAEQQEPLLPRPSLIEKWEIPPLRRNPYVRNISSLLLEHKMQLNPEQAEDEPRTGDLEERGRSMIRTSDIIEARLSRTLLVQEEDKSEVEEMWKETKERTVSPVRQNPVD
jgi:hypothetical protein